jgi:hypothetical protein
MGYAPIAAYTERRDEAAPWALRGAQKGRCPVPSRLHHGRSLILAIALISIPGGSVAQLYGYGYRGYAGRYLGPYGYAPFPTYRTWGYGYRPYYGYAPYPPYYGGYYGYVGPRIFLGAVILPPPPVYVPPPPPPPPPPAPAPPPVAAPAQQCGAGSIMGPGGYCEAMPTPTPERG